MKFSTSILLLFMLLTLKNKAATCTAVASTNWSLTSTWSCGAAPSCNDIIVIPSGFTVTINKTIDLTGGGCTGTKINIYGVLFFSGNGSRLDLVSTSTVNIYTGGKITTDQPGNNSQKINIGTGASEWSSNNGNLSGPWTITNGSSGSNPALPIQLINFSGVCIQNGNQLNWATATEKDNEYFMLEMSLNATDWTLVTKVKGSGTSSTLKKYSYLDRLNNNGLTYYRLSQIDKLGTSEVFKIIDVSCNNKGASQPILYPNPAATEFHVLLNSNLQVNDITLKIYNIIGELVLEKNTAHTEEETIFSVPMDLKNGPYNIVVFGDNTILLNEKLIILR